MKIWRLVLCFYCISVTYSTQNRLLGIETCWYYGLFLHSFAKRRGGIQKQWTLKEAYLRQCLREIKYQILVLRGKEVFLEQLITIHSQSKSGVEIWRYTLIILVLSWQQDFCKVSSEGGATWASPFQVFISAMSILITLIRIWKTPMQAIIWKRLESLLLTY